MLTHEARQVPSWLIFDVRQAMKAPGTVSIRGPIEREAGKLILHIPLEVGGCELVEYTRGIARVDGSFLVIELLPWMLEKLGVAEGAVMAVDNLTGEFRMQKWAPPEETPNQAPTTNAD